MLRKNTPVKFSRPVSSMKTVLEAIEQGHQYRHEIVKEAKLPVNKVRAALWNLTFIGVIQRGIDREGRNIYVLPGRLGEIAPCLLGVRSIFDVR